MEMEKQTIQYARAAMKFNAQAIAEGELTPPASLPAIARVLTVDGRASASADAMDGRMLVEGSVTLSVLYICDEGKVHGFESIALFKHNIDVPGLSPEAKCRVWPCVGEIRHHLTGGALHIRSQIALECRADENAEIEAIERAHGAETRWVPFRANKKLQIKEESSVREDIRLPRSADRLLGVSGCGRVHNVSMESGKAVVDGVLRVTLTFCTPDGTLMQAPASLSFSDKASLPDNAGNPSAQLRILMLSAVLVDDDIATVDAQVEIILTAEVQKEHQMIGDAYSTKAWIDCIRQRIPICRNKTIDSRCTLRQTLTIPGNLPPADRVLIAQLRPCVESATPLEGTLALAGTMRANIIYLDREGELHGFYGQAPFQCEGEAAGLKPQMDVSLDVSSELVHAGASGMEIQLQSALDVTIDAEQIEELTVVTDMAERDRESPPKGLLVYFPEEGEGMWAIGKRFGVGLDTLHELNPELGDAPRSIILNLK